MKKTVDPPTSSPATRDEQQTSSHIPVRPLYTPADLEDWDYDRQVGYPGEPFDPSERKRALIPRKYQGRRFLGVFACGLRTRSKDQDNLLPRQTRHLPIAKDFRSGSKSSKAHSSKEGHSKGGS